MKYAIESPFRLGQIVYRKVGDGEAGMIVAIVLCADNGYLFRVDWSDHRTDDHYECELVESPAECVGWQGARGEDSECKGR